MNDVRIVPLLEKIVELLTQVNNKLDKPLLVASARDYGIGITLSPHLTQGPRRPEER